MPYTKSDVTVLGTIVLDIFVKGVNSFPPKGQAVSIDNFPMSVGGCGANTSIALTKLGAKVSLIGNIGDDFFGKFICDSLKKENLTCNLISTLKNKSTSLSILFLNKSGERSYFHSSGANEEINLSARSLKRIFSSKIFHIGGAMLLPGFDGKPMAKILRQVKKNNVVTSVDLGWDISNKWMEKLKYSLKYIDILFANELEIKALTQKKAIESAVNFLHKRGPKIILIKLGSKGAFLSKGLLQFYIPAIKAKAIDTTGAGDNFVGGFLFGLLNSWSLIDCVKLGNTLGALTVRSFGAQAGLLNFSGTMKYLKKNYDINNYA